MAFIALKYKIFATPSELATFATGAVTTIYSIVYDNSGKYIIFYV